MAANRKLTPILASRTVESVEQSMDNLLVHFTDGSTMRIKTAAPAPDIDWPVQPVKLVRQTYDLMKIVFTDASIVAIRLAGPTASVMLRDAHGILEYAD